MNLSTLWERAFRPSLNLIILTSTFIPPSFSDHRVQGNLLNCAVGTQGIFPPTSKEP